MGVGKGVGFAVGAASVILVAVMLMNHFVYYSKITGAQVRAVLTKAILEKSFRSNEESKIKYSSGKIISIMSTDGPKIDFAIGCRPFIITFPVPFGIAIGILVSNIGWPSAIRIAIIFMFMLGIAISSKKSVSFQGKVNEFTYARIIYIKEALTNSKIMKFYSWEEPYQQKIANIRSKEMKIMYTMQILRSIVTSVAMYLSFSALISFLIVHAVNKHEMKKIDSAFLFSSVSRFYNISKPSSHNSTDYSVWK